MKNDERLVSLTDDELKLIIDELMFDELGLIGIEESKIIEKIYKQIPSLRE